MFKSVKFKAIQEKGSALVKYPDDRELFTSVVLDDEGYYHAIYSGKKKLTPSDLFKDKLLASKISDVKQVAYTLISEVDGHGGWKLRKAEQKYQFEKDDSGLKALYMEAEVIRGASNKIEDELSAMSYEELLEVNVPTYFIEYLRNVKK